MPAFISLVGYDWSWNTGNTRASTVNTLENNTVLIILLVNIASRR